MPPKQWNRVSFSSVLRQQHRRDLEELMFFNPDQDRVREGIISSVRRFGNPRIVQQGDVCRVAVGDFDDAQTLYAFEAEAVPRLVGCIVYVRDERRRFTVVHIAVAEDHVMASKSTEVPLAVRLLLQVLEIARQIKGIEAVAVQYTKGKDLELPIGKWE